MASEIKTEVLVIGSGSGGYSAAFRAADLGLKVTLVEADDRLGGVCLIRGCIPSKALLHVAALKAEARDASAWGLTFGDPVLDLAALRRWKDGIVDRHTGGLKGLCRRRGVDVVHGRGSFTSSTRVSIEGSDEVSAIEADSTIVATGSRPLVVPGLDLKSERLMDSTAALQLPDVPETMLVIGGGYIGLELGSVYAEFGSRVTVVELTGGLLPGVDPDLVKPLHERVEASLEAIYLNTRIGGLVETEDGIAVTLEGGEEGIRTSVFDRVLMSVGRRPNSDRLGIEQTNVVVTNRGFLEVDAKQQTADPHIFAIGDVAGEPGLAHKAVHEGKVAAEVLAGEPSAFDNQAIPAVVFTDPEIAWCGLTESGAKEQGLSVEVARFPWVVSGRASTLGRNDGLTKLILEPDTERVLGVGIVGHGAGELIAEGVLAVEMGAVAEDLAHTIHPHPTLSESMGIAAEIFLGTVTDLYVPKRT